MKRSVVIELCAAAIVVAAAVLIAVMLRDQTQRGSTRTANVPSVLKTDGPAIYDNPFDSPQTFMEGIYAADQKMIPPTDNRIRGLIVPHHLVASESIASGIRMLTHQTFKHILLLSPDHYNRCETLLCTVNGEFHTLFGDVYASTSTIETLIMSPHISTNEDLFQNEHGIYDVVPFIAHYLPNVTVTPVVLSQHLPWKSYKDELRDLFRRAVDQDTILVVSSDFSHYLPLKEAEKNDALTIKVITDKDLNGIASLINPDQSDCPGCLWNLAALAQDRGFYNPSVILHTNSVELLNNLNFPTSTSHFSMVWYEDDDVAAASAH
jgi:AmmeMemoRadiSam system protein B